MTAIDRLPEERQQLLYLKFIAQLSNAEVGEILGRTEGAIKSLYHRTLLTLRDDIDMQRASSSRQSGGAPEHESKRRLNGNDI